MGEEGIGEHITGLGRRGEGIGDMSSNKFRW